MLRFSTGLRDALATNYGLGVVMGGGVIYLYGGTRPASPDDAPGSTILGIISQDGNAFTHNEVSSGALQLEFASPGGLFMKGSWRLKGSDTGTATWWRWCWGGAENFADSTHYPRIDGDCGPTSEIRLATYSITPSTDVGIDAFLIAIPME